VITDYHAKLFAHELSKRHSVADAEKLAGALLDAQVDLNPHQVEAALFAFKSPLSKGAILADEVGLGKTIEAGLVLAQKWTEGRRRILVVTPANLRKQWSQEIEEKFFLPTLILEARNYNKMTKEGVIHPLEQKVLVICSFQFAARHAEELMVIPWDLVVIDEAHRLRNVYRPDNRIGKALKGAFANAPKVLLTATPLQNSLMELYGLVSLIDDYAFGDAKSFRAQYSRLAGDSLFAELKGRLKPVCHRTLRRQVLEYIRYTNRIPITQEFVPTEAEQTLYDLVSDYLRRPSLQALPSSQRSLMTRILRKLLASSTFAIAGALDSLARKLERQLRDDKNLREKLEEEISEDYEEFDEITDEWEEHSNEPVLLTAVNIADIEREIVDLRGFRDLAVSISENAKGQALLSALRVGFAKASELGSAEKAIIFTESRRTQEYLVRLLSTNGYDGKLVLFNGSNSDLQSKAIYLAWVSKGRTVAATLEINRRRSGHVKPARVRVSHTGDDLFVLSGHLPAYRGLQIVGIDEERQQVALSDGTVLNAERASSEDRDTILETQIYETVREHLEKELAIRRYFKSGPRLKVLSLFFIDRVTNYAPADGKFRRWFDRAYLSLSRDKRYTELDLPKASRAHAGYFSSVRNLPADTSGKTAADDDTYKLIMQDKQRLLSPEEPVRFIFSHSALREGWDNPNVFQICTLNQTKSDIKKRQEIGRGLRLPVAETGYRVADRAINFLTVIANESYDDFARKLQSEIAEECGVDFGDRIHRRGDRREIAPKSGWRNNAAFKRLWKSISAKTEFQVTINRNQLIKMAVAELKAAPNIQKPKLVATKALLDINAQGVHAKLRSIRDHSVEMRAVDLPNPVDAIQELTGITRSTIVDILDKSGRLREFLLDPDTFIEFAVKAIGDATTRCMVAGVRYRKVRGQIADIEQFASRICEAYANRLITVSKSIYKELEVESEVERRFARGLDARRDIAVFLKMPDWLLIPTPAGKYNPDWALIKKETIELYLVRETKSAWYTLGLRGSEKAKIDCAGKHFRAVGVDFSVVTNAAQV
jgi:superfamily II DNA or RNA helicase